MDIYKENNTVFWNLRIKFEDERGIDAGGLIRDAFSAFWEKSYGYHCDGSAALVPLIHPSSDLDTLGLLGRILSHGYILCGYLPVRIVFPSLCAMLLGSNVKVPADILVDSFKEYLPEIDRMHLQQCFTSRSEISMELKSALVSIFSRFGCLEVPTASNILRLCEQVAMYEFLIKPMAAINAISSGIASEHREFWNSMSVHDFHDLYLALTANPLKIIQLIEEPCFTDPTQEKVFNFLLAFIGTMRADEVQRFLRFVTGSSVCLSGSITICFNTLSGFSRRPIAHTCARSLHLSSMYKTYIEFSDEFNKVLSSSECWRMDGI